MPKYLLRLLTLLAIATPLALAGCHSGGDEHPGEDTASQSAGAAGSSEHPGEGSDTQSGAANSESSDEHPGDDAK